MLRHCDSELDAILNDTVPPCDLEKISAFRAVLSKHKKETDEMKMAEEEQLLLSHLMIGRLHVLGQHS